MSTAHIPRETFIEQSVQDCIKDAITRRGLPSAEIEHLEAFSQRSFDADGDDGRLDKNYIALGFNYDPGGTPLEMGSSLIRRTYSVEVFVVAMSAAKGSSLAYNIRDEIEETGRIPLLNITADRPYPVIDYLLVDPVRVERQAVLDPDPWQEFFWLLTIPIIDEYDALGLYPSQTLYPSDDLFPS